MRDPAIVEELVRRLSRKATTIVVASTLVGASIGAAGAFGAAQAPWGALVGCILGALVGSCLGTEKASHHRREAREAWRRASVEDGARLAPVTLLESPERGERDAA